MSSGSRIIWTVGVFVALIINIEKAAFSHEPGREVNPDELIHKQEEILRELRALSLSPPGVQPVACVMDPSYLMAAPRTEEDCAFPSQYVCDPKRNPHVANVFNSKLLFDKMQLEAELDAEVQKILVRNPPARHCSDLKDLKENIACVGARAVALKKKIYTEERLNRAAHVFDRAKGEMLEFLNYRLELLEKQGQQAAIGPLKEAIRQVSNTKLNLSHPSAAEPISFNAMAIKEASTVDLNRYQSYGLSLFGTSSLVRLEGVMLMGDLTPDALLFVLRHEFAHIADFFSQGTSPDYKGSPFSKEKKCLKRADTAGAKKTDLACMKMKLGAYRAGSLEYSVLNSCILLTEKDADFHCELPREVSDACQQSQMGESIADWIAAESGAYAFKKKNPAHPSFDQVAQESAFFCAMSELDYRGIQPNRPRDTHPNPRVRLDRITLAHPAIYADTLGCPKAQNNPIARVDQEEKFYYPRKVSYCGEGLYQ